MGSTSLSNFKSCSSNQDSFVLTEGEKKKQTKNRHTDQWNTIENPEFDSS